MLFLIFIVRYIVPVLKIHKYNLTSFNTFSITATKRICKFNSVSGFKYRFWNESTKKLLISLQLYTRAVEEMGIELSLSHVAPVLLHQLLDPVFPPHMWWLVRVSLQPFPPVKNI